MGLACGEAWVWHVVRHAGTDTMTMVLMCSQNINMSDASYVMLHSQMHTAVLRRYAKGV